MLEKELKQLWYRRLAETGYHDIEQEDGSLKAWDSFRFQNKQIEAKREYFLRALDLLNTYSFDNPTHHRIWELHCNGASKRKIEREIMNLTPTYKRSQIGNILTVIAAQII